MNEDGQLRSGIIKLLLELTEQYFINGDISAFESEYLQKAGELLNEHQFGQSSLVEHKMTHIVRLQPPTEGLNALKALLQTHRVYFQSLNENYALSKKTVEAFNTWKVSVRGVFDNPYDEFCLQTAYMHFVRLFFVRVCEDYDLIPRRISDGTFARYEHYRTELLSGIKDTYLRC